jgi:hypothetical protein
MISVTPLPPQMGLEKAATALNRMMEPMMWAGTIHGQLLDDGANRALLDVTGNHASYGAMALRRQFQLEDTRDVSYCD